MPNVVREICVQVREKVRESPGGFYIWVPFYLVVEFYLMHEYNVKVTAYDFNRNYQYSL